MRINTQFPVAVHALALITLNKNEDNPSTSDLIAKSVGTNPVVIRRLMTVLKQAGLIEARQGSAGIRLLKDPGEIKLLDIYKAVQTSEDAGVFDIHKSPSMICPVGRNIHHALQIPLIEAQRAMEQSLAGVTLDDVAIEILSEMKKNRESSQEEEYED